MLSLRKHIEDRSGLVYIAALVVMVILLGFGLAYMFMVRTQIRISTNEADSLKAFYLAEAGAEYALAELICGFEDCSTDAGLKDGEAGLDFDGDSNDDAEAHYNSGYTDPGEIKGRSVDGMFRAIEAKVNTSGVYGAIVNGRGTNMSGTITGEINGNVDGTNEYGDPLPLPDTLTVIGTVTTNSTLTFVNTIPDVDFAEYKTLVTNTDPNKVYDPGGITYSGAAPTFGATGMYYVEGDLTIDVADVTLNGTIIVNGNLFIESDADNLTITPQGNHPAIVADYIFFSDVDGTQLENVTLGMVYVDQMFNMQECTNLTINGALVVREHNIELFNMTGLVINYDPDLTLESPYFSGGKFGYPKIVLWQGYEDTD